MSELITNKITPGTGSSNTVTLGDSGDTFTIPAGVTITNSGTATGFSTDEITKQGSDPTVSTNPSGGVGSLILNTSTGKLWACTDATAGANVWKAGVDGSVEPFPPTTATGGTITTDGDYKVHTFTSSGNFVVSASGQPVEYLAIAGGGGGGSQYYSGGGGAGGYLTATSFSVSNQTYAITVGAGGAGGSNSAGTIGANGSTSTFSTISPVGGGGGGKYPAGAGASGGSGGGSSTSAGTSPAGGSGTAGQGNNGASGFSSGGNPGGSGGGGGGGAGGSAVNRTGLTSSTDGGVGLSSSITGSAIFRAGGGGAGVNSSSISSAGGNGGGGVGSTLSIVAGSGTANTGSGGGGADHNGSPSAGGNGGSGVVILRYKFQ